MKSLLAFLAALAVSGLFFFVDNEALAKSAAIDSGSAETVSARLDAWLDENDDSGAASSGGSNGPDEWRADFATTSDPQTRVDTGFNVPGKGEVLDRWDGATVTCYLWDGDVIGVKLPDGTVLKRDNVGWRGVIIRWSGGMMALGVALLIGGIRLSMGFWTGFVGGVLVAGVVMVMLHLNALWVALVVDLVLVLAVGWWITRSVRAAKAGPAKESEDPEGSPDGATAPDAEPPVDDADASHSDWSPYDDEEHPRLEDPR